MGERKRTCAKRERPNVPVTCRLDFDAADRVGRISEETGLPLSVVLEKLVLYALPRVVLAEVKRKEITFPENGEEKGEAKC